jgi:hypothetical protein
VLEVELADPRKRLRAKVCENDPFAIELVTM